MKEHLGFCTRCKSSNIIKNGHNGSGQQQYFCKDCKAHRVLDSEKRYPEDRKGEIIRTYFERSSLRGLERIFHVSMRFFNDISNENLSAYTKTPKPKIIFDIRQDNKREKGEIKWAEYSI